MDFWLAIALAAFALLGGCAMGYYAGSSDAQTKDGAAYTRGYLDGSERGVSNYYGRN